MKLYVIRNNKGQFFKPSGLGGNSNRWRNKIEEAKIYTKIGPCKAQVTGYTQWFIDHKKPEEYLDIFEFEIDPSNPTLVHEGKKIVAVTIKKNTEKKEKQRKKYEAWKLAQAVADDLKAKLY